MHISLTVPFLGKKYYLDGADELLFMDVVASLYGRNNILEDFYNSNDEWTCICDDDITLSPDRNEVEYFMNNVDKILGHGEQPITADNSLILTPDKPVSARSIIRGIPVLLRYCNASLGIISSIFFPAGEQEKMKERHIANKKFLERMRQDESMQQFDG